MNVAFPLFLIFAGVRNHGLIQEAVAFAGISRIARPFGVQEPLSALRKCMAITSPLHFATPTSDSEFQADAEDQVPTYFTVEKLEEIKFNENALENFERELEKYVDNLPYSEEKSRLDRLIGAVQNELKNLRVRKAKASKRIERVADIDYEIDTTMVFRHDYDILRTRIAKLFGWYEEKHIYLAPYFPIVQSSGTGKTKLLYEYRQNHIDTTLLILCVKEEIEAIEVNSRHLKVYNYKLLVPSEASISNEERVRNKLDSWVKDFNNETKKVVLLFDEAQSLLEDDEGFFFRVIRLWLRDNKFGKRIVALFTGTSTRLTNFFREDPVQIQFSRDSSFPYNTGTKLYEPFYELNTFGLEKYRLDRMSLEQRNKFSDLQRAAFFGRPLFARLAGNGKLLDQSMDAIKNRMVMSKPISRDMTDAACLSVLGSRVQMGQTSIQIASDLVAGGYACLTKASTEKTDSAFITFFPDPVPAYLAMTLMRNSNFMALETSLPPSFWTTRATGIISSGLCLPDRGDVGEVAASLYLLFSGDVVRLAVDDSLKTFAVPLSDFLQVAAEPTKIYNPRAEILPEAGIKTAEPQISFIQVCRNYLSHSLAELTSKRYLEEWFTAGLAFYSYPKDVGYDILAPIRIEIDHETKYYPMLISVKNKEKSTTQLRKKEYFKDMKAAFESMNDKIGVCVLVEVGLSKASLVRKPSMNGDSRTTIADKLRDWKADGILEIVIVVPEDDCFGCWDMAAEASTAGGKAAEIYASHFLAHQIASSAAIKAPDILLRTSDADVISKFNNLMKAYRGLGVVSDVEV